VSTFLQLYGEELSVELASSDTSILFTTARRKQAINDGMNDFVRQTSCTKKYGSISLTDEVGEYDLYSLLTDYVRLDGDVWVSIYDGTDYRYLSGDDLPRRDPEELDFISPGWRAASVGTPNAWYLRENTGTLLLGLTPAPDIAATETWAAGVPYIANPTTMTADGNYPFTVGGAVILKLTPYHRALVHYAAAKLESLRKNYDGVTRQTQLYIGYVAQYLRQMRQEGGHTIQLARNYFQESQRGARPPDPTRWP